jgi:hypothetical protein
MAASVNSSCAPRGPRNRRRPSLRMRFKWANSISRITWSHRGVERASIGYTVEPGGLRLSYQLSTNGTGVSVTEVLPIVTTATQFGGRRHWFSCPGCGRRCRIVYHSERFRCRRCLGAHHQSQYQNEALNTCARRWRLRSLLEERGGMAWPLALDDGFPPKPPRMHWKRIGACRLWTSTLNAGGTGGSMPAAAHRPKAESGRGVPGAARGTDRPRGSNQ